MSGLTLSQSSHALRSPLHHTRWDPARWWRGGWPLRATGPGHASPHRQLPPALGRTPRQSPHQRLGRLSLFAAVPPVRAITTQRRLAPLPPSARLAPRGVLRCEPLIAGSHACRHIDGTAAATKAGPCLRPLLPGRDRTLLVARCSSVTLARHVARLCNIRPCTGPRRCGKRGRRRCPSTRRLAPSAAPLRGRSAPSVLPHCGIIRPRLPTNALSLCLRCRPGVGGARLLRKQCGGNTMLSGLPQRR